MNEIVDKTRVDLAVMAVDELTKCSQEIDLRFLHLGKMLLFVKEKELYKHYSEHTQTMSAFLREIDIGIGMSQSDHLIRIYRTFGEKLEGRKIAFKRLLLVHSLVTDDASIEPLLDMAESLPLKALNDTIREMRGRTPSDACSHPMAQREEFWRCCICHQWIKREG